MSILISNILKSAKFERAPSPFSLSIYQPSTTSQQVPIFRRSSSGGNLEVASALLSMGADSENFKDMEDR